MKDVTERTAVYRKHTNLRSYKSKENTKIIKFKESLRSGDIKLANKGSAYNNVWSSQFRSNVFENNDKDEGSLWHFRCNPQWPAHSNKFNRMSSIGLWNFREQHHSLALGSSRTNGIGIEQIELEHCIRNQHIKSHKEYKFISYPSTPPFCHVTR